MYILFDIRSINTYITYVKHILHGDHIVSFQEKSAWAMAIISIVAMTTYISSVLPGARELPLVEVNYVGAMLSTIALVILAAIIIHIIIAVTNTSEANDQDERDMQINRYGDAFGQWLVAGGAMGALLMSVAEWEHFWIANTLYLAFLLATLVGSGAKIVAYRRGF